MKKVLSLVLSFILIFSLLLNLQVYVSADSMYIKKVVSVVYDDSTSMIKGSNSYTNLPKEEKIEALKESPKWTNANYAMQTFCGMLNEEDKMFITYMSDFNSKVSDINEVYDEKYIKDVSKEPSEDINLSAGKIQQDVDSIRNHMEATSTPEAAVFSAYKKLKDVGKDDTSSNTQYWLVVFTDGVFNVCQDSRLSKEDEKQEKLDEVFDSLDIKMPNGSDMKIVFVALGNAYTPTSANVKEIYEARNDAEIIMRMSEMVESVSGRKKISGDELANYNKDNSDKRIIKFYSELPLQNIVVFEQNSDVELEEIRSIKEEEKNYKPKRDVSVGFGDSLKGKTFLVKDNEDAVMPGGDYEILFDGDVELSNIDVLFEPALDITMIVSINGGAEMTDSKEIKEALKNVVEGDKISVSYKVCEIGTDKVIADEILEKSGAKFDIAVVENGTKVDEKTTGEKTKEYTAKNEMDTNIGVSVTLDGFAPIERFVSFKPHYEKINYSITSEYGNGEKSIKMDDLANNEDFTVCFTVLKDGEPITDPEIVKSLNPEVIVADKQEKFEISDEGKIIFTPKSVKEPSSHNGSIDVNVVCKIDDKKTNTASCEATYGVIFIDYLIESEDAPESVRKTRFFGNKSGVKFVIKTEDGRKLSKAEIENGIEVSFNEKHSELKQEISISPEGDITVIPYSEEEHIITFWNWWVNWAYYFGISGEDVEVTLKHTLGTGVAKVDVTGETLKYQILNVYLPLFIELAVLAVFITWLVLVIRKPRFMKNAVLYVGDILYNSKTHTHTIYTFDCVKLDRFNNIWKKENGRLKFKAEADIVSANGIRIRADYGGRIICEMEFPWFKSRIKPLRGAVLDRKNPQALAEYFESHYKLDIDAFAMETVEGETARALMANTEEDPYYFGIPDHPIDTDGIIKSGQVIIYTME